MFIRFSRLFVELPAIYIPTILRKNATSRLPLYNAVSRLYFGAVIVAQGQVVDKHVDFVLYVFDSEGAAH
ncbi:hypothetical protein [Mesorhizobium sp. LjRoot246]|uniref:hypothetical protein n=1 Tax=Mesorhizobium sp. LjRoot246 TaxID=3342294 RepID=UPI003ECD5D3B